MGHIKILNFAALLRNFAVLGRILSIIVELLGKRLDTLRIQQTIRRSLCLHLRCFVSETNLKRTRSASSRLFFLFVHWFLFFHWFLKQKIQYLVFYFGLHPRKKIRDFLASARRIFHYQLDIHVVHKITLVVFCSYKRAHLIELAKAN